MITESISNGKKVAIPIVKKESRTLKLSEFTSFDKMEENKYGVLEPTGDDIVEVSSSKVDMVIVPGVAFDEQGNRFGYGAGFFDKLLASFPKKVPYIALAYELQIVEGIKPETHDVKMDKIITEERIIEC